MLDPFGPLTLGNDANAQNASPRIRKNNANEDVIADGIVHLSMSGANTDKAPSIAVVRGRTNAILESATCIQPRRRASSFSR